MDELSGKLSDNETLHQLTALSGLLSTATEADATRPVLSFVTQMLMAEGTILWLLNDNKTELNQTGFFHTDSAYSKAFEQEIGPAILKLGKGLAGWAWGENRIKILQMPGMFSQSQHSANLSDTPACSVAFPLKAGNTVIGVMEVVNCSQDFCAGDQHPLLLLLSSLIGSCIFGNYAIEKLKTSENAVALSRSKLDSLNKNLRELKNRLSKEHDQSLQTAKHHAQFLTRISRDIRTPLSGITSIVELLLRAESTDYTAAHLSIINESAASILTVLEELVEFSRHEAEQFAPPDGQPRKADSQVQAALAPPSAPDVQLDKIRVLVVNGLLGSAEFVEAYAMASGIKCESTSRGQSALIAMKQALLKDSPYDIVFVERLLPDMDAFQFARAVQQELPLEHTKLVLVSTFDSAARDDYVLRAGFTAHIPKPVKQQQLIRTLNALMRGEGQIGADAALLESDQITPAIARGQRMILVAEDNPVNQKVALLQLRELGFFSTVVENGRQVVDVVKQADFDAILMDCQMPELDGYGATKLIRQWEKATGRHVPIIAMTASALSSDREQCLAAGMDDYLSKPVTYDKLDSVLSKWVESKEARELAGAQRMQRPNRETEPFGAQQGLEPIDIEGLKDLLGAEETGEVLQLFVNSTQDLIEQIKLASDRHDAKSLKEAAHQLKGAAASVGANNIASNCLELERCAKEGLWDAIPKVNDGLIANFENAKSYIRSKFS